MLCKITNHCAHGCSHCMEESTVQGEHMTLDVFVRALDFTERAEERAWALGCPRLLLLSGGECSEHPGFLRFIELVEERGMIPMLITNGSWLADVQVRDAVLRPGRNLLVQVTYDSRFYPREPPVWDDPRITYVPSLTVLVPLGRAARKKGLADMGLPLRQAPSSFNLRSATRQLRSFPDALALQRVRAASGLSGHCTPSISNDGVVVAGETRLCWPIGTVDSTMDEVTHALCAMGECNRCGLETNLSPAHKRALGLSSLYAANE